MSEASNLTGEESAATSGVNVYSLPEYDPVGKHPVLQKATKMLGNC